ncbi:OLC1v1025280C2 [Oldenlandia corymbosa var. corymbosa]|nr:OLC1v1025280C2 [Oldenlandia corymbosa var. corymbosa]
MAGNPHYEGDPKAVEKINNGYNVKPRALNIVWGNDPRYWEVPSSSDSNKPAELLQVCWLEVTGSVDINPKKRCEVAFEVSLTPDAFGWGGAPVYIMAKRGKKGKFAWKKEPLITSNNNNSNEGSEVFYIKTTSKPDPENLEDTKLYFGLYEVWSGKWKGGLKINKVIVKELLDSSS